MKTKEVIESSRKLAKRFRVMNGKNFKLSKYDPGETLGFGSEDKPLAKEALENGIQALAELQDMLYA
ncbi:hypothetical protein AB4043_26170, partial [Terriglobus sp. YAF25]